MGYPTLPQKSITATILSYLPVIGTSNDDRRGWHRLTQISPTQTVLPDPARFLFFCGAEWLIRHITSMNTDRTPRLACYNVPLAIQ